MPSKCRRDLDPLDLEILERAWAAVTENDALVDLESDEALEAALRRELIEIACSNGVSDPETLRDVSWMGCLINKANAADPFWSEHPSSSVFL